MSKILVAMVTFGNVEFTKMAIRSFRETIKNKVDFFVVVGKPGDSETLNWLSTQPDIKHKTHTSNMGFPYSVNDIYDHCWVHNDYDYLILAGNDIIAYPGSVDNMIKLADTSDYECISALQYDVKDLVSEFPETRRYFSGSGYIFCDFDDRPWELFKGYSDEQQIADMKLYDIQNLCLYKKSVFDKIGYTDVSFYPAYFVDNDYARRIVISGLKCCTLATARFFHFWSRTIHQGDGGSNHSYFRNNEKYYKRKWGGPFGAETLHPDVKISDRLLEIQTIDHWRKS